MSGSTSPSRLQADLPAQIDKMAKEAFSWVAERGGEGPDMMILVQAFVLTAILSLRADPAGVMAALTKNILAQHPDAAAAMRARDN